MSDVEYNSSLTVGIIFGSIGLFLVIFIIYLSCRQRRKQQQANNHSMLINSHSSSSQTPFLKKTVQSNHKNHQTSSSSSHFLIHVSNKFPHLFKSYLKFFIFKMETCCENEENNLKPNGFLDEIGTMRLENEIYKQLGVSLSQIPFIDETPLSSCINTRQNSCHNSRINLLNYQQLT